jgi:hypothetical protein
LKNDGFPETTVEKPKIKKQEKEGIKIFNNSH